MKTFQTLAAFALMLGLVEISLGGWETSGDDIYTVKGNVGIGTTTPGYGLDVEKATGWTTAKFGSKVPIYMMSNGNPTIGFNARCVSNGWKFGEGSGSTDPNYYGGIIGLNPVDGTLFLGVTKNKGKSDEGPSFAAGMYVTKESKVGIGTTSPQQSLSVNGALNVDQANANKGFLNPGITFGSYSGEGIASNRTDNGDNYVGLDFYTWSQKRMSITLGGNVGIGTTNPQAKLDVVGRIRISDSSGNAVLEMGEGLDYAEGFDVSGGAEIEAGSVLVIDSANPGKLALSQTAYDRRVAGIVAGAKGLGSGVRLGVGQFDCSVALAGRVYCSVDATQEAVEPGDLLTTAVAPGYAMKAVDYERARGATLGKAMEKLEKGKKGQILVLVTLQ